MTGSNQKKRRRVPAGSQTPKRRKYRKGKRGLYAVPVFLIALIVGTILCCTVFFKTETITVEGNTRYTAEQVIAASGIQTGENLLRLKKDKAADGVTANLVYAETVTVKKHLPGEVIITVSEPAHTAVVTMGENSYALISGKGRILEYGYTGAGIRYEGLSDPVVENGYLVTADAEALTRLNTITAAFNDGALVGITAVGTSSATVNYAVWANKVKILLGSAEDLTQKVKFAKYFIENGLGENETGIADVSAGKQLYFDPGPLVGYEDIPVSSEQTESSPVQSSPSETESVSSSSPT